MSNYLSFKQYQEEIKAAVKACDTERLNLFCHEVVSRILPFVFEADISDLYEPEIKLLKVLQREAQNYPIDWSIAGKSLDELSKIDENDEAHGLDMDGSIVEFLCALDNWRSFCETKNKESVCRVSENLMNILDFYFVENASLEKWLSVPELNAEFNKQILFLRNNQ